MTGRQSVPQEPLFYGFSLERHVPAGHLLCSIGRTRVKEILAALRAKSLIV